jgi:two-component sensor histidine kinase
LPDREVSSFARAQLSQGEETAAIHQTETVFVAKSGKEIPISLSASIVQDDDGTEHGVVYVARDLTRRKQAEAQIERSLREKEVLLSEIHHRVKNNLQIISSLLMLQSQETADEGTVQALRTSRNRIQSMAIIHETLYQSEYLAEVDLAECIRKLVDHLAHSYADGSRTISTSVDVGQVSLSADLVIQCGLIINELVSNALKHAFPSGQSGEINVAIHPIDGDQVILTVNDNGIGLPPDVSLNGAESLGLQLAAMLIQQIEGKVEVDRSKGTTFRIKFST